MINRIFERALNENENKQRDNLDKLDMEKLKNLSDEAPSSLNEAAQDAFMMLQVTHKNSKRLKQINKTWPGLKKTFFAVPIF